MGFPQMYPMVASVVPVLSPDVPVVAFQKGRPQGVTVHYTADGDLKSTIASLKAAKLAYHLIIDRDGKIYQTAYFNQRVAHAGVASWRELSPNRWHAAIAVVSWGALKKTGDSYVSWSGTRIPAADVVRRPNNIDGKMAYWHAATDAQAKAVSEIMGWFTAMAVDPKNFCGHDECALPLGRKQDPGGVLPWTMQEVRDHYCKEVGL